MPSRKILVVEDDPLLRRVLHTALSQKGFQVGIASDALTALSAAQRDIPDLIILDLGLPAGGGMGFLEKLARFPRLSVIPVVVVTAQERAAAEKAVEAGARAYLQKPVNPAQVLQVIDRVLTAS